MLPDSVVDSAGQTVDNAMAAAVTAMDQTLIWEGDVPAAGQWQWVGEVRSADGTQVV